MLIEVYQFVRVVSIATISISIKVKAPYLFIVLLLRMYAVFFPKEPRYRRATCGDDDNRLAPRPPESIPFPKRGHSTLAKRADNQDPAFALR